MSLRNVARSVVVSGAAILCGALFLLAIDSGSAGADLVNGFTTLHNTSGPSGTPYGDGQNIVVTVAAGTGTVACPGNPASSVNPNPLSSSYQTTCGSAPTPNGTYYFEECVDPGGTSGGLPTSFNGCEAGTMQTNGGNTSTGAVSDQGFTVFVLPDVPIVGGPTIQNGSCGIAPNYCVVGIFSANPNSGHSGFSFPHVFSAPFQVDPNTDQAGLTTGNTGYSPDGSNPGDGTPEISLAIGLPLAAIGIFGGVLLVRNRRRRQAA